MKKTILTLACAVIAPLAFAQTSTTTTETSKTKSGPLGSKTETTTSTTSTEGTVSTFEPGKTIVVRPEGVTEPTRYPLRKAVPHVNKSGKTIEASMIKPGVPVDVYYDTPGSTTVSKVVVEQD